MATPRHGKPTAPDAAARGGGSEYREHISVGRTGFATAAFRDIELARPAKSGSRSSALRAEAPGVPEPHARETRVAAEHASGDRPSKSGRTSGRGAATLIDTARHNPFGT